MAARRLDRSPRLHARILRAMALAALGLCAAALTPQIAHAQTNFFTFPDRPPQPPKPKAPPAGVGAQQMLIQATELRYDYTNNRVSAVGNVQIYHQGSTIEADRVIYDQRNRRMRAEGNVRLTEADGRIVYGEILDLNDDFRDGFVDSLRLDQPDQTRLAAARAQRSAGNFTVLESGVYTACEPCKDDPKKPPLWQIKAARIIHDEGERMIYFEDAKFELFGQPIAYFPFFSTADPSVKRKSGFLTPSFSTSSATGVMIEAPYYWALSPDHDVTLAPQISTRQGPLLAGEWRQRLINGSYMVRASGIFQLDKDYFLNSDGTSTSGYRDFRGAIETSGQFALNNKWVWGWDGLLLTDKTYFQDYNVATNNRSSFDPFSSGGLEGVSQLYLTGKGDRSYFDLRTMYFYGFSQFDRQSEIPIIHPVWDYNYVVGRPVFDGELSYKANLTSLTRTSASFDPINVTAATLGTCDTADPAVKTPANCVLRGVPGTYTRFSAQATWRRTITDAFGQVFTPFASLRADVATVSINNDPSVANYITTGDYSLGRLMPTAGVEYRYPFINVQSWGTQTIQPIAQIILRPNEPSIGKFPNEDAQSLIFDDSNLFKIDKFSGYDRMEGGGRANVGIDYTAQFNQGGFVNAMFGQSFHLFGTNSFATGDIVNAGVNSGLETDRSDYVARFAYQPDRIYTFTTRFRFDEQTFAVRRFEAEGRVNYDRWSAMLLYGNYDAQPEIGFLTRRQGILGGGSVKLSSNWALQGAIRYDIEQAKIDQTRIGVGYIDDCLVLAVNYVTNYNYNFTVTPTIDHRVMLQVSLRTLGSTSLSQSVGGVGGILAVRAVLFATCLWIFAAGPAAAQVVLMVNGEPITAYDIEQRGKLTTLTTRKSAPRPEIINELIDEKLKVQIGKRYGLDIPQNDIENSYAGIARRMRLSKEQFDKQLESQGVNPSTLKSKLRADTAWAQIVRGKFQSHLQVGEKDIMTAIETRKPEGENIGYEYLMRPILFVVPRGAPESAVEQRRKEAEALRARFQGCEDGLVLARGLRDVAVREPIRRNSADLSPQLRQIIDAIPLGRLTPPEVTSGGVELFALCGRDQTNSETPIKRAVRDEIFAEKFEAQGKRYLKELRGAAMIEYRQ